ncbi:MAG TPA: phosphoadenosine phosphosulfate reductase family protein [Methylococcus sp.]|nr:phosphoadenosine phosphosulfate reductase family protein [Methylococcus sp.]
MHHAELETFRLHARLPSFRRRVREAMSIVRQATAIGGVWACCVSGGKDSTVLTDLCVRTGWRGPLFNFRDPETPDENTELCARLAERYGLDLEICDVPGAFDVYEEIGHFFTYPTTDAERAATRAMISGWKRVVGEFTQAQGWSGHFWGLRKGESRPRNLMLAKKGPIYRVHDRPTWTACPLARWTGRDVWAYTVKYDLPWLSCYDDAQDKERQRSQPIWLSEESVWAFGQGQEMRRRDLKKWIELIRRFPELSQFS